MSKQPCDHLNEVASELRAGRRDGVLWRKLLSVAVNGKCEACDAPAEIGFTRPSDSADDSPKT